MPKVKKKIVRKTKKKTIHNTKKWQKSVVAYVADKLNRKNIDYLSIKLVGSRVGARHSDAPKETSDVDVVVMFPRAKDEKGTAKIKKVYKRLGISMDKTHPWRYDGVRIDFIPETKEV